MALSFSPSGQLIANAFRDGHIRVSRPDLAAVTTLQAHGSSANTVAWYECSWILVEEALLYSRQPDESILFSGSDDRTIAAYATKSWTRICTLSGHEGAVRSICVSPSGIHLASASADFTVRIW